MKKLQRSRQVITIKPADKNLGVVVLDTEDYLIQCCNLLTDEKTYRQANEIRNKVMNTVVAFKTTIQNVSKKLYSYLQPPTKGNHEIIWVYGLPKIHKEFERLPPLRPIVAQSSSLLTPLPSSLIMSCNR